MVKKNTQKEVHVTLFIMKKLMFILRSLSEWGYKCYKYNRDFLFTFVIHKFCVYIFPVNINSRTPDPRECANISTPRIQVLIQ